VRTANKQHSDAVLSQGAWFKALPPGLKSLILDNSILRTFKAGEVISAEDQRQSGLWGLLEGQVAVTRRVAAAREFFSTWVARDSGLAKPACSATKPRWSL